MEVHRDNLNYCCVPDSKIDKCGKHLIESWKSKCEVLKSELEDKECYSCTFQG
jgi:hypothetical protein